MENLLNYKNTCINLCVVELFKSNYMKYVGALCFLDLRVRFGYIARNIEKNRKFPSGTLAVTTMYGRFISDLLLLAHSADDLKAVRASYLRGALQRY